MVKKFTLYILMLIFLYTTGTFFLLGLVLRCVVGLIYTASLNFSLDDAIKTLKMSAIAGIFIAFGSLIFNKIDEYNDRKKKRAPQDPSEKP